MATGKLIKLVHLSLQRCVQSARLVMDRNDKGYGIIEDAEGQEVFFAHDAVENRFGFDDLRKGQQVEYTLENAPYLRATSVRVPPGTAAFVLRPAA
jgi:cold shock CspA family protein